MTSRYSKALPDLPPPSPLIPLEPLPPPSLSPPRIPNPKQNFVRRLGISKPRQDPPLTNPYSTQAYAEAAFLSPPVNPASADPHDIPETSYFPGNQPEPFESTAAQNAFAHPQHPFPEPQPVPVAAPINAQATPQPTPSRKAVRFNLGGVVIRNIRRGSSALVRRASTSNSKPRDPNLDESTPPPRPGAIDINALHAGPGGIFAPDPKNPITPRLRAQSQPQPVSDPPRNDIDGSSGTYSTANESRPTLRIVNDYGTPTDSAQSTASLPPTPAPRTPTMPTPVTMPVPHAAPAPASISIPAALQIPPVSPLSPSKRGSGSRKWSVGLPSPSVAFPTPFKQFKRKRKAPPVVSEDEIRRLEEDARAPATARLIPTIAVSPASEVHTMPEGLKEFPFPRVVEPVRQAPPHPHPHPPVVVAPYSQPPLDPNPGRFLPDQMLHSSPEHATNPSLSQTTPSSQQSTPRPVQPPALRVQPSIQSIRAARPRYRDIPRHLRAHYLRASGGSIYSTSSIYSGRSSIAALSNPHVYSPMRMWLALKAYWRSLPWRSKTHVTVTYVPARAKRRAAGVRRRQSIIVEDNGELAEVDDMDVPWYVRRSMKRTAATSVKSRPKPLAARGKRGKKPPISTPRPIPLSETSSPYANTALPRPAPAPPPGVMLPQAILVSSPPSTAPMPSVVLPSPELRSPQINQQRRPARSKTKRQEEPLTYVVPPPFIPGPPNPDGTITSGMIALNYPTPSSTMRGLPPSKQRKREREAGQSKVSAKDLAAVPSAGAPGIGPPTRMKSRIKERKAMPEEYRQNGQAPFAQNGGVPAPGSIPMSPRSQQHPPVSSPRSVRSASIRSSSIEHEIPPITVTPPSAPSRRLARDRSRDDSRRGRQSREPVPSNSNPNSNSYSSSSSSAVPRNGVSYASPQPGPSILMSPRTHLASPINSPRVRIDPSFAINSRASPRMPSASVGVGPGTSSMGQMGTYAGPQLMYGGAGGYGWGRAAGAMPAFGPVGGYASPPPPPPPGPISVGSPEGSTRKVRRVRSLKQRGWFLKDDQAQSFGVNV